MDEKNKIEKEIEDALKTVGIMVRAKINKLCNDKKFTEAKEIQQAYDIMNKYFEDQLKWEEKRKIIKKLQKQAVCGSCKHIELCKIDVETAVNIGCRQYEEGKKGNG